MDRKQIAWWLWAAGTVLIVLSWVHVVTPFIGWCGFGAGMVGSVLGWGLRPPRASPSPSEQSGEQKKNSADAGRALRMMMLTTPPSKTGQTPTKDFPRIYGILMDWPIGETTASVFSTSTGAASLYTTSTFGIIGGEGHETVRSAAMNFVRASDRFFETSSPTTEYPYPAADRVRFYFLTFDGVRVIETDLATITNGTSTYAELFGLGQAVLTELRLVTENVQ